MLVPPGKMTELRVRVEGMGGHDGVEVPPAQQVETALHPVGGHGTAGRDDRDPGPGPQPGRAGEGLQGHFFSSSRGTSVRSSPKVCA